MNSVRPHPVAALPAAAPTRHPSAELLIDTAGGALSEPELLMIVTHLASCETCRDAIDACDAVGGALLDALEPAHLPPDLLNRTLAAIDRLEPETAPALKPLEFVEKNLVAGRWTKLPGGYGKMRVSLGDESGRVWLLKAPAGKGLLRHRHVGDEWTVVMQGAFTDETGTYRTGDFVLLDDGFEHRPKAELGEDCICLIMVRETPRYRGAIGRLMAPFARL
jgi:putative transcriptional regulator